MIRTQLLVHAHGSPAGFAYSFKVFNHPYRQTSEESITFAKDLRCLKASQGSFLHPSRAHNITQWLLSFEECFIEEFESRHELTENYNDFRKLRSTHVSKSNSKSQ